MKQNDKITRRRNQHTVASRSNDIDLSSFFTEYNQSHLRVARKKKYKIEFFFIAVRLRAIGH